MFELELSLIYRGVDQKIEDKLVFYLPWINMYSSAQSHQENNHCHLDNKSIWASFWLIALLFELDPVEHGVSPTPLCLDTKSFDSPGHALLTNPSPKRLNAGTPEFIHYTRRVSFSDVTPQHQPGWLCFLKHTMALWYFGQKYYVCKILQDKWLYINISGNTTLYK